MARRYGQCLIAHVPPCRGDEEECSRTWWGFRDLRGDYSKARTVYNCPVRNPGNHRPPSTTDASPYAVKGKYDGHSIRKEPTTQPRITSRHLLSLQKIISYGVIISAALKNLANPPIQRSHLPALGLPPCHEPWLDSTNHLCCRGTTASKVVCFPVLCHPGFLIFSC